MNQYASSSRTYIAPNLFETVIAPPAVVIVPANTYSQIVQLNSVNMQSNLFIKRMGLFSNFADGLVLSNPAVRPTLSVEAVRYSVAPLAHVGTITIVGKALTGVGTTFTLDIAPGALIWVNSQLYFVNTVTDNLNATVTQYSQVMNPPPVSGAPYYAATIAPIGSGNIIVTMPLVDTLNCLYDCEKFIPVALYGTQFFLMGRLICNDALSLETISVDTAWAGKSVFLDLVIEAEITATNP